MDLLDLMVKIGVKDEASAKVEALSSGFMGRLKTAAAVGAAAVAAVGAAAGVASKVLYDGVKATAEYGDHVDKMSQKIGFSAEAYQKWDYVMQRAGASVDSLQAGMKTLSTQAEANAAEFQKLGISQEEVASLSKEDLFYRTIQGLASMEDGTERTAMATTLLGRAATELGPLLNEGTDAIEEQMEMAERYGLVMSDSAVKASADFNDSLTTLSGTVRGLKFRFYSEFLPAVTAVTDGLALIFVGDTEEGLSRVREGVTQIADKLREVLPQVMEVGGEIVSVIAEAILSNMPTVLNAMMEAVPVIIEGAGQLVGNFCDYIMSNSDTVADAAMAMLVGIVTALVSVSPKVLAAVGILLASMLVAIGTKVGEFFDAAVELIGNFIQGVGQAGKDVSDAVGEVIQGGLDAIGRFVTDAFRWGQDIVKNIADGISSAISWVTGPVTDLANTVASFLHFSEPDVGPLSNFHTYMPDMIDLMAEGIEKGRGTVRKAVGDLAGDMATGLSVKPAVGVSGGSEIRFRNMGVYINEDLLIGAIVEKLDNSLGVLQTEAAR